MLSLTQQSDSLNAFTASNAIAATRLSSTATSLTTLQSSASSFLDSLTTASTGGGSIQGLQTVASGNLQALIANLNTSVGGQSIFGGLNTAAVTMTPYAAGSASKTAVDQAFQAQFGTSQTSAGASSITAAQMTDFLTNRFAGLFSASSYSATWSSATTQGQTTQIAPGQTTTTSVSANEASLRGLAQVYTMVTEFTGSGSTLSASAQQAVIAAAKTVVGQASSGLTTLQADVGVSQGAVTAANTQIAAQTTVLATQASSLHDVDPYALNQRITALQTQIEASYELTTQLKQLSLVNYFNT